ncbi:hypothetical protein EDC04DRAFT_2609067 [Pisolithus marmoratus]|nr:hypothetical protein EDC04DRAFT_2609067 [Pisolithus marmoratus]
MTPSSFFKGLMVLGPHPTHGGVIASTATKGAKLLQCTGLSNQPIKSQPLHSQTHEDHQWKAFAQPHPFPSYTPHNQIVADIATVLFLTVQNKGVIRAKSDKGGNRKTRKWQPMSGEESEAINERKSWPRKKQKGTTGERIPAASVQKMSKTTAVGARGQVVTGSNMTEQIDTHTGSNPEAAMTVDNDTMGVDDNLNEENLGKVVSKTQLMVAQMKSNATKAPNVDAMGREVKRVATRMAVNNEEGGHVECARPSMVSQLNGKGKLIPNWHLTKVHLAVPTQSQPNSKTSNSKTRSQHHTDGSTSNPDGVPQEIFIWGLDDGDDTNDSCAQVLYTSAFHLTLNSKPISPLLCLKKPGPFSSGHVNVESECGHLTIDKHQISGGDGDCNYDGYRGDNMGSDQDECSDDDNDNDGNGNNGGTPALVPITSCGMEQSGNNVRALKKGPSNSSNPVVRVFNCSLSHKVPGMEQPSQQVWKPSPSQNWAVSALSHMQGHGHHAVEADKENFEGKLKSL